MFNIFGNVKHLTISIHRQTVPNTRRNMTWLKSEYLLRIAIVPAVFICSDAVPQEVRDSHNVQANLLTMAPVPWVGVLLFKPDEKSEVAVAGVILIHSKIAIANARDLAKINKFFWTNLRDTTKVMFLTAENKRWYAQVLKISVHPEYNEETLTTIGILDLEYDDKTFQGEMLRWPGGIVNVSYVSDEIYVIGFTDQTVSLEQIVYRMNYVSFSECVEFYVGEELDSQWMRPVSYHCYRVRNKQDPCVFDPGMALVHHSNGNWTLLGMSTWGPGCSLPGRFLDFEYFIHWISSKLPTRKKYTIRKWEDYWKAVEDEDVYDLDTWILTRLNDTSVKLEKLKTPTHQIDMLKLGDVSDKNLIYRDVINFTSRIKNTKADGVYGLSFYDLRFNHTNYNRIIVTLRCAAYGMLKLGYTEDFQQGHFLDPYIKETFIRPQAAESIQFLKQDSWRPYSFKVLNTNITNLMFKFQYENEAQLEIVFYGNRSVPSTTTPPPTTTPDWLKIPRTTTIKTTTVSPTTTTKRPTTTNWWHRWWRYQGYAKIPGEDGGDVDWWKG